MARANARFERARYLRRASVLAFAFLASTLSPLAARAAIAIEQSAVANLVYHLDCISGAVAACGARSAFRDLWKQEFGVDPDCDAQVIAWRAIRDRHRGAIGASPGSRRVLDLEQRLRGASLAARSFDEYYGVIAVLINVDDARRVREILEGLRPAFEAWWTQTASAPLARNVQALSEALQTSFLRDEIARIERLYAAPRQEPMIVQALHRPPVLAGNTTAQLVGDYAVAEIPANDLVELRVPVLVHEYAHRLLARLTPAHAAALQRAVLKAGGGSGRVAWMLFDEALATAVGNGRIARSFVSEQAWKRHLRLDQSFYRETSVDVAAKAILPIVDTFIDRERAITDAGFAEEYAMTVVRSLRRGHALDLRGRLEERALGVVAR